MKSKPLYKVSAEKGTLVASKAVADPPLSQPAKAVASSSLSQKNKENVRKYMARTHDSFARGLAASSNSENGALAGGVLKRQN